MDGPQLAIEEMRRRRALASAMDPSQVPPSQNIPEIEELKARLTQYPQRDQFQPSKLRTILGGIAAGYTGLSTASPGLAEQTFRGIREQPYRTALSRYAEGLAPLEERAKLSAEEAALATSARRARSEELLREKGIITAETESKKAETERRKAEYEMGLPLEKKLQLEHPVRPPTDTPAARMERLRESLKTARQIAAAHDTARIKSAEIRGKGTKPKKLSDDKLADLILDKDLYIGNPEYHQFYDEGLAAKGHYVVKPPKDMKDPTYLAFLARRNAMKEQLTAPADTSEVGDEDSEWEEMEE